MKREILYSAIGEISEDYLAEARVSPKKTRKAWIGCGTIAAALCMIVGGGLLAQMLGTGNGLFGTGDATVYAVHREDFTPEIESAVLEQFEDDSEVKKAYLMRTNEWFLSDELTDFSQAVTTNAVYVAPGGEEISDPDTAFSIYALDDGGALRWNCTAYPPSDASYPFEFSGLTYDVIDQALSKIEYEDYIITYAPRMGVVFVWVRCAAEDLILAYPTRPDLLGLENGGTYTLEEVQTALSNAYHSCEIDSMENGHSHHHTEGHHEEHAAPRSFVDSKGCSNRDCTDPSHFHNCDENCNDPAHYHTCDENCTIAAHGHPVQGHHGEDHGRNHGGHH